MLGEIRSLKRPTNLSIDAKLLTQARRKKINLSSLLERALRDELRCEEQEQWVATNERALNAYAEHVASAGVFSDGQRRF
jgi:antitoxin CcdA